MCCVGFRFVDICHCRCRVEDYWHGYKLFCYTFYSHSLPHEHEFQESKLHYKGIGGFYDRNLTEFC